MKSVLVIIFCLLASSVSYAQVGLASAGNDTIFIKQPVYTFSIGKSPVKNEQAIPQNFYAQHLGFFCRQELKMQDAHVPVTFRLGSMDYCNYLEQKPGYR